MNTPKITFAFCLLTLPFFAQVKRASATIKPGFETMRPDNKAVVKKVNPLYATSISRRTAPVIDNDKTSATAEKSSIALVYEIKAFPNPFSTQLDIFVTDGAMDKSVYLANLYDISGKLVFSERLTANQSSLALGGLSPGIYILGIDKNGIRVKSEKLVKE